jgi:oxygen-independent coproporphyrinogen-3 oxidase
MKKISLYIHIPFCKSKCKYCDFLSFDNREDAIKEYINTLIQEINNYSTHVNGYEVSSIFIGGGTPSILSCEDIRKVFVALRSNYNINRNAEITIEANPGTLTTEKIQALIEAGVNRVSLGLQSCNNNRLTTLGRIHTWEDFLSNYNQIRELGINNINVDLMFGLPNQDIKQWENDLRKIISIKPEHISCYGLIIEEGTRFYKMYNEGRITLPSEEIERDMYWITHDILQNNNYKHYEISNFALDGKECYHNKVYWKEQEYIGIGLGASSYFEGYRYKNISDFNEYINCNGNIDEIKEQIQFIDEKTNIEEYMFLGLRLLKGINKLEFYNRWGKHINYYYKNIIIKLCNEKLLYEDDETIKLTAKGIDVSNYVLSMFLMD